MSAEPDNKYSLWKGFIERHITASVWVDSGTPGAISAVDWGLELFLGFSPSKDLFFLAYSLVSRSPRTQIGSQFSESKFQISISGKNVPTTIRLDFCP